MGEAAWLPGEAAWLGEAACLLLGEAACLLPGEAACLGEAAWVLLLNSC